MCSMMRISCTLSVGLRMESMTLTTYLRRAAIKHSARTKEMQRQHVRYVVPPAPADKHGAKRAPAQFLHRGVPARSSEITVE